MVSDFGFLPLLPGFLILGGGGMDGDRLFLLFASFNVWLSRSQKLSELIDGRDRDGSDTSETLSISSENSDEKSL